MNKKYRLSLLGISVLILLLVGWFINKDFSFIQNQFWFSSGLLLMILLSLIDQPHFSKESNVFVNAVTAGLSLLLIPTDGRTWLFWTFCIIVSYLLVSSYVLLWLRQKSLEQESSFVQFISRVNRTIGRPEALFSAFFLWGGILQFSMNSAEFNALLWFWILFMIFDTPTLANTICKLFSKRKKTDDFESVGEIFGIQSKNTFLVKLDDKNRSPLKLFDCVEFIYSMDNKRRLGLVLDVYLLNSAQWIKVLSIDEITTSSENTDKSFVPDEVYKTDSPKQKKFLDKFVGIVVENSTIGKIRFSYNSKLEIHEGSLIELKIGPHTVLYQVIEGITKVEQLENKNESSLIIGEAIQLGEWNKEEELFDNFGWVPSINTPIFIASNIDEPTISNNDYKIGAIPGTNYPVVINKELAVTHHTAILGVTGSGKSVFTRNLIHQLAADNTKVIIVDLTGEYKKKIPNISVIISDENSKKSFDAIEAISTEKAKFPNQQNRLTIEQNEQTIKEAFYSSIKNFLEGNNHESIFEIPDITNNSDILEYTKWFFWCLFKTAKTKNSFGKRVCVVLEEAHTIIPELNSMGVSDFSSKATVNSIAQIALQGRKYNIGFIVIAQRTANVSKTVLTQCNSIITFKTIDKTSNDFLSNYYGPSFIDILPCLKFRTAIAVGKAFKSTTPMIFEVPQIDEEVCFETGHNDQAEIKS